MGRVYGARRVILPSIGILGLLLISFKFISARVWQLYAVFLFLGFIGSVNNPVTYCKVVSKFAGASLVGLGMGGEGDLMPYIASRYFGLQFFGEIYGSIFAIFTLSGAAAPFLMAVGFDRSGSYRLPLSFLVVATLISTILMSLLGPYTFQVRNGPSPAVQP
jgi:hypothetical protein